MKRVRQRYLALRIDSDDTFDSREFMNVVWNAILKLYGEYGASQTRLALISYDAQNKFVVLRTAHTSVDMVRAALASTTQVEGKPVAIHVLRVSGSIKTLSRKMKS